MADSGQVEEVPMQPAFQAAVSPKETTEGAEEPAGMSEGYDEESPLVESREACPRGGPANGSGDDEEEAGSMSGSGLPPGQLPREGMSHGRGMPLTIIPVMSVRSEGAASSGGFPLGRSHPTSSPAGPLPQPQRGELKKVLCQQLEYYFSKENLSQDKFLRSQMDAANYVPVSVISNFNQVKKLTADMSLILEALRESPVLQLDEREDKVRAIPEKRCVLILREIPQDTPKADIEALFDHEKCPNCVTCEFADNNCWYVTFESEESTQKAFTYLREQVREFLGQPIRARIKGTTVQRSSGMPKNKHVPFNMQSVYNGGAPQQMPPYYPPPSSGVMPWSPTPPTSSASPYFDPSSFGPYGGVGNGFTPPPPPPLPQQQQQQQQQQPAPPPSAPVGVAGQSSPAGGGVQPPSMVQPFNGGRFPGSGAFPFMPMGGDRGGRGRMGLPNRPRMGERGQSPPVLPPEGEPSSMAPSDRDNKLDYKGGHLRDHHGSATAGAGSGGPGMAGSGRYRQQSHDDRKMPPRHKTTRHGGVAGSGGRVGVAPGGEGSEKNQLPPRQQNKPQPKLDLATAHFPPLPTSSSSENGATPSSAPPTISHSHTSLEAAVDGPKTLSDIVKGSMRASARESPGNPAPSGSSMGGQMAAGGGEKLVATGTKASGGVVPDTPPQQPGANSDLVAMSSEGGDGGGSSPVGVAVSSASAPPPRVVTASSIVAGGSGSSGHAPYSSTASSHHHHAHPQNTGNSSTGSRAPPPPPAPAAANKVFKGDAKTAGKDRTFNNGNGKSYRNYQDREINSSKQNRNSQVQKSDSRSLQSNARGRYKERDFSQTVSRGGAGGSGSSMRAPNGGGAMGGGGGGGSGSGGGGSGSSGGGGMGGQRQPYVKSPKSFKKNFSPHSLQAPPPPPTSSSIDSAPSLVEAAGGASSSSGSKNEGPTHSQSTSSASKPERLSYAQMAQKKNLKTSNQESGSTAGEGGVAKTSPPISPQAVTTPTAPPPQSTPAKAIKSTSTGSLSVGQSSAATLSKSAPTSPTKELGGVASGSGLQQSKDNEV